MATLVKDPLARFRHVPVLTTERLMLGEITEADFHWYVDYFSRPEIAAEQAYPSPADEGQTCVSFMRRILEPFEARDGLCWGLWLKHPGAENDDGLRLIGSAGVFSVDPSARSCGLGYELDPEYWRRGLMTEALRAVLDFAFVELDMNRVQTLLVPRKMPARLVVERLGFVKEGVLRECVVDERGALVDDVVYSLLAREWRARRPPLRAVRRPSGRRALTFGLR
jgi:ribosomal-protein-alanine N-acetyltransferase